MLKLCDSACEASMEHVMVRQHAFIPGTLYVFHHFLHQLFGHTNNATCQRKNTNRKVNAKRRVGKEGTVLLEYFKFVQGYISLCSSL